MRSLTLTTSERTRLLTVPDVAAWDSVVQLILPELHPGMLLALSGQLGAGKTTFTQALARGLGVKKTPPSPTFALMRSYALPTPIQGIKRIVHVDAYRIEDERELLPLDLGEELADRETLLVLEWPEKVPSFIAAHADRMTLTLS